MLPPPACGGRDRHVVHPGAGHASGAQERLERNPDAGHELGRVALGEVEELQVGVVELAGRQQAEAGQDRRPAPVGQLEAEELDGEHIARLCSRHVDGACERVDGVEVERAEVLRGRVAADLAAREVVGLDHDDVALLDVQHGLDVDVPPPVGRHGSTDQVLGHGGREYLTRRAGRRPRRPLRATRRFVRGHGRRYAPGRRGRGRANARTGFHRRSRPSARSRSAGRPA